MPWGRVDDTWYDHPKLEQLEDERTWPDRLAGAGLNSLAWSWCNRFLTDGRIPRATVTKLGGTLELADMLVRVGLWEEAPGGFQIHDFLVYNDSAEQVRERRATEAARKAAWREKHRPAGTTNGTSSVDDVPVPPSVPPGQDVPPGQSAPDVPAGHGQSPAGTRARASRSANPDPTRPVPSRPTESLEENRAPRRAARERADVAALRAHGWKRVTAAQRKVLDELADRHRHDGNDGTWFAAEAIAAAGSTDPLKAAIDADRLWQQSQRRRADAEEAAWSATKAQERAEADRIAAEPPDWLKPKVPA